MAQPRPARLAGDAPTVSVAEGSAAASYQVVLRAQPASAVTIAVSTDGQLRATPARLTFTAATWRTPQTVRVEAVDDATAEGPHGARIEHHISSRDALYDGLRSAAVVVKIADNDAPASVPTPTSVPPTSVPQPTGVPALPMDPQRARVWLPLP